MKAEVIQGDGLEAMRAMADAYLDAVVTDPPYCAGAISESQRTGAAGQGLRSENLSRFGWFVGDNMGTAGLVWLLRALAFEAVRVLKPSGSLLVFCDWKMLSGTTGVACAVTGREFVGAEREAEHCEVARCRIDYAAGNLPLFAEAVA